ncbi:MAG: carbon-nitrogen hydrolase family protein [Terriglobia bacterium]|jgi:N-carbamoylputrescine amidase
MRLSLIQMNSRAAARDENVERACQFVSRAAADGANLIVLPEFFNCEYFPQFRDYHYMDYAEPDSGPTTQRMRDLAKELKVWIVSTIFELERPGLYYDTAMLISPEGAIAGKYRKVHPAALLSLEKIYFRGGSSFPVFKVGEWTVGISICYDNLFPESCRCLAIRGAELIVAPYATPIDDPWENFLTTRALENGAFLAACNHVGREGEWRMSGKSMIINPCGKIAVQASGWEEEIISLDIAREDVFGARRSFPLFRDRRPEVYSVISTPVEELLE